MMERQADDTLFRKASSIGKTVKEYKEMVEDADWRKEQEALDDEDRAYAEADAGADETASNDAGIGARANWGHGELMGAAENQPIAQDDFSPQSEEQAKTENTWRGYVEPPADQEMAGLYEDPEPMGMLDDLRAGQKQKVAEAQAGEFEDAQGGFMPPEGVAPVPPETQLAEDDPAVQEALEIQKKAAKGDPEAKKAQEEIYKGLPKEEKAMAKEELGNYYIGPGGYAINLETVESDLYREAKFSMLHHIPDHAKAQMLASWGFIDQEDVDKMPDDPKIEAEKIKATSALAVQEMIKEGIISVANINNDGSFKRVKEQTRSAGEIAKGQYKNNADLATMNNSMKEKLTRMDIDWKELQQHSVEIMHLNDLELEEWKTEKGYKLKKEEMQDVRNHFAKEMKFKYKNMENVHAFKGAQLAQRGAEFSLNFGLKSTEQQQAWIVKQHTMMVQKAKQLLDSGQPTAAMMVYKAAGSDIEIDIPGFWKQQAKTSAFGDKKVMAAFSAMGYSGTGLSTGINKFVAEQSRIEQMYKKTGRNDETGLTALEDWVEKNKHNKIYGGKLGEPWEKMSEQAKNEYPGGYPAWENEMVAKAIHYEMGRSKVWGNVYRTMNAGQIEITPDASTDSGEEAPPPKEDVAGETTLDEITDEQAEEKKFTDNINKTFAAELQRGDEEYQTKFASFFRSPSSKSEALKVGKKDLGFGMRKHLRGLAKDHGIRSSADIDELIEQPKKLTEFFRNNIKWFKKLSPEAQFYVAQQDSNIREGLIK